MIDQSGRLLGMPKKVAGKDIKRQLQLQYKQCDATTVSTAS
jgi:hypothetical protein